MGEIVETITEAKGEEKALEAHLARAAKYADQVVVQPNGDKWIYYRNAETGEIDFNSQPTTKWADPSQSPDNTFVFQQPPDVTPAYSGNSQWDYVVRERPEEWSDAELMEDMEFNAQYHTPEFR